MSKVCPTCARIEPNTNVTAECHDDYKFAVNFDHISVQFLSVCPLQDGK